MAGSRAGRATAFDGQDRRTSRGNVVDGEVAIEELFRGSVEGLIPLCRDMADGLQYVIQQPAPPPPLALDGLMVTASTRVGTRHVIQYENGSIALDVDGERVSVVMPVLCEIAADLHSSPLNGNGNAMNTRQLGAAIIAANGASEPGPRYRWTSGSDSPA